MATIISLGNYIFQMQNKVKATKTKPVLGALPQIVI